jgi:prepilin-type N-terminal cleavage/methylation domain-containing protein
MKCGLSQTRCSTNDSGRAQEGCLETQPRAFPNRVAADVSRRIIPAAKMAPADVGGYAPVVKRAESVPLGRAGFSLIEVLAVAAILLLLFALYWAPRTSRNRQRQAQLECQTHLQKIYVALSIYAGEHADTFPVAAGARTSAEALDALVPRYTSDTAVFFCPGTKAPPLATDQPLARQRISYAYYIGRRTTDPHQPLMSDEQVNTLSKNAGELAFSVTGKPPGNNHDKLGGNLLFCDGRTEWVPPRLPFSLTLTQGVVLLNPLPQ